MRGPIDETTIAILAEQSGMVSVVDAERAMEEGYRTRLY